MVDGFERFKSDSSHPAKAIQNLDQGFDNPAFLRSGSEFTNDILILVLKPSESNSGPLEMTCTNQYGQGPTSPPVESNPGPQKMPGANQDGQKPVSPLDINTEILILVLKTPESNPGHLKMTCFDQDGLGSANLLGHRLELVNYSATRRLDKEDSLNGHQIATSCVPLRTQTYAKVVACLKEFKTRPDTFTTNKHQLPPVPSPELAT
ncbi:hypothetical protein DSO57_1035977 [Entomophthora muscae]|uniref:Uncharacterized protein n=1 Tax=Entomophthora muscae TaxID=34485 RepID=A0ACC2S1G3_9FUNG|nr:hypothetical protein DSO57_1035977 [Entomophthora muscae]